MQHGSTGWCLAVSYVKPVSRRQLSSKESLPVGSTRSFDRLLRSVILVETTTTGLWQQRSLVGTTVSFRTGPPRRSSVSGVSGADVEVIATVEMGRKIQGIRRRFVPLPDAGQITVRLGVPCTKPSRTIIDVAGIAGQKLLADTIEQAAVLEVLNVPEIDGMLLERRRRGEKKLHRALEPWRRYTPRVRLRSRMEAKMLPLLTHHHLPIPETNVKLRIEGEVFEVDFLWRGQRVVVETDGGRYHDNPIAQARDGHRNRALARAGYRVPRIGWDELRDEPDRVIAEIRRFLVAPVVP